MTFFNPLLYITVLACSGFLATAQSSSKPNIILIFTDDQGYQDIGVYGSPNIHTPNLDRMAADGMRFTDFYAQTVCGPSRAALMTGSYPLRVATKGNRVDVHPYLHTKEITIAEVLKPIGYKTAAFGKWDLAGHTQDPNRWAPELLPTHQGFDYFFGTSSSNDRKAHLIRNETIIEMEKHVEGFSADTIPQLDPISKFL